MSTSAEIIKALRDVVFDDVIADTLADAIKTKNEPLIGTIITNAVRISIFNEYKDREQDHD